MSQETIQGYRLSPQQRRWWELQEAQTAIPSVRCTIEISGELDENLLQQAIDQLVADYEILRTSFQLLPGMTIPVQVIADPGPATLRKIDAPYRASDDLSRLPLLTAQLVRKSAGNSFLLLGAPALCLDRFSLQLILHKLANNYEALCTGRAARGDQVMQYADVAEWQNELAESPEAAREVLQWKHSFGVGTQTAPFAKARATGVVTSLPLNVGPALKKIAAAFDATAAVVLHACWAIVLSRSSGSNDSTVAVLFDGRNLPELTNAIGPMERRLPLTLVLEREAKFSDLLRRLKAQTEEAARVQQLVSADAAETNSTTPFAFSWQQLPADENAQAAHFSFKSVEVAGEAFALELLGEQSAGGLINVRLTYDSGSFTSHEAALLAERLETIIDAPGIGGDCMLASLNLIGGNERHALLHDFNDTGQPLSTDKCVYQLFEEQVERTPDATAVVFENERLSFAELNKRANRVADYLRRHGVGPDVPVGLCLERSAEIIVGVLGIWKARGAYVPLDPGLPRERLQWMLDDTRAQIVLGREAATRDLNATTVDVEEIIQNDELGSSNCDNNASPQSLAYIIFTSGSTGRPKGVAVEHRNLANYVHSINARLNLPAGSSYASVSTIAADLGNTVLFPPLVTGGTLHLIAEERATNPDDFAEYCRQHAIDCLKIVPSHLNAMLSAADAASVLPAKRLVLGGEACPASLLRTIKGLKPQLPVLNHYGPTEATVGVTTHEVTSEDETSSAIAPLGRPLANTQIFILDEDRELAPIGVVGELHIAGAGVARNYVGRPDATADKFVPHPFATTPGQRLYRTGDMARFRSDGTIEFMGRVDDQVKIHGYRIEPQEIAALLRELPPVKEAIVIAREDEPGDKRLVAYVTADDATAFDEAELRQRLQSRLPDYMMPKAIVQLSSLPLTRNGKIDRKALPVPDQRTRFSEAVAPRNEVETVLAAIWSRILGVEKIGIHDNFFELGGDSILSIQIIARANQAGLKLSPRHVFQHQTIAELAAVAGTLEKPTVAQDPVTGDVPLTPVQLRFLSQPLAEPHHYNQAVLLDSTEPLDIGLLTKAFAQLSEHHDVLRSRFEQNASGFRQHISPIGGANAVQVFEFPLQDLETQPAALHASLNLEKGPLLRAALFRSYDGKSDKLLIVIHHLVVDGVSWRILLEDLQALYNQLSFDHQPQLPPKTTSFKNWSEQLQKHADSMELRKEYNFWRRPHSAPPLPVDHHSQENNADSAATVTVALNPRETLALLMEAPSAYRTQINEVLITALARTLEHWTGSPAVLLDLEGHGREEIFANIDLTRTVGWFTTIFPVALDLSESKSITEALRVVKEQLRAIPNRGIGYGLLRYLCSDEHVRTTLKEQQQAQLRFNYLGQTDRTGAGALLRPAAEATGPSQSPSTPRGYLLNVIAAVTGGQLRIEWTYSRNTHERQTIEHLAEHYASELRMLIAHAREAGTATLSPSDFSSAKLSREDLSKVLAKLRG